MLNMHLVNYFDLGYLYEKGIGVQPDMEQAIKIYQQAAEKGEERAVKRLNEYDPRLTPRVAKKKKNKFFSFFGSS